MQYLRSQVLLVGLNGIGVATIAYLWKVLPGVGIFALTLAEGDAYRQAVLDADADDLVQKAGLVSDLLLGIWPVIQS